MVIVEGRDQKQYHCTRKHTSVKVIISCNWTIGIYMDCGFRLEELLPVVVDAMDWTPMGKAQSYLGGRIMLQKRLISLYELLK